jgi:hypothetical protein
MNHVDPSTSSGSSPGAMIAQAPRLRRIPAAAEYLKATPFRTLTIPFDTGAAQPGDCGVFVDTDLLARTISCAVTGCTEIYRASADDTVSTSSKYICKHHPHTVQSRTLENYAKDYPSTPPKAWTSLPKYEMTDSGKKTYPYRFRSKNKLPENRLTLRLDINKSPSPTLDGLIPITMGTTLAGEELYCFVPPNRYERLKQVCVGALPKKPKKQRHATDRIVAPTGSIGVVQRNYPNDDVLVPVVVDGYESTCVVFDSDGRPLFDSKRGLLTKPFISSGIGRPSGKRFLPWLPDPKPEIDFPTWISKLPRSEQPTPDAYKMLFGNAHQIKLKWDGTQDSMLLFKLPSLSDLPRKELFRVCAERKHLYQTVTKFLRQAAPELFKHSESVDGPPDPRRTCPRCGGSWLNQKESHFTCRNCGQHQYTGGTDEFDQLETKILPKSTEGPHFGEMTEQTTVSKLLDNAGFEASEKNGVTVYTLPLRSDEPNIARMTNEEFVSVCLWDGAKRYRGRNPLGRLTVLYGHFCGTNNWLIRDYAEMASVPTETAETWVKRFEKQVGQYRAENRKNVALTDKTKQGFKSLLVNKMEI